MIVVMLLPIFFMIFMVLFPLFWALAFCGCWFLPLTKFSKVLISVLILAMLCGGIAFFFESSSFSFLFACGFISLPVFLRYFWRSQESYEKYYHIIHTNPLSKNNLKRRAISLFSIGLLGTFMSLWQLEVPQKVIVNLLPVKLEIVNDDFEYIENPKQNFGRKHNIDFDNFERKESKNFLNFKYTKYNIYACDDFTCKGDKKYVGYMWKPWSERSFLGGCVNAVGKCLGSIEQYKTKFEYFVEYSNLPQFNKGQ